MKIGLVRRGYSPTGGAESYLLRLAAALEAAGHQPGLVASREWPPDRWPTARPVALVPGSGDPRRFAAGVERVRTKGAFDLLFSLERVWRCDCYRAGDGVHRAWLERRAAAEPAWRRWLRPLSSKHRWTLRLEKSLFAEGGAGRIIANSRLVREEIIHHYATPPERVAVVYNGLPAACFTPFDPAIRERERNTLCLQPHHYAILFAGTGWERKGLVHALRAVERLPTHCRPVLLVAGSGHARRYLRSLSPAARERVRFLGPVRDMRALYAAADVFVAPTLYDPFSNACLEALAAGLPVLTTGANGFSEIIDPGTHGEVFPTADRVTGEQLAALLVAWHDHERWDRVRALCAARAGEFTMERNVAATLALLLSERST